MIRRSSAAKPLLREERLYSAEARVRATVRRLHLAVRPLAALDTDGRRRDYSPLQAAVLREADERFLATEADWPHAAEHESGFSPLGAGLEVRRG